MSDAFERPVFGRRAVRPQGPGVAAPERAAPEPIARAPSPSPEHRPAEPPAPEAPRTRPPRILAAEDNALNAKVLVALLAQVGVEPVVVENGALALEAWETGGWDVILMDVQMPQMDGPAATKAIRARERELGRPKTPIIALTANAMTHQVEGYFAAGMDDFVPKPIEVQRLFEAIRSAISRPRAAA